MNFLQVIEKFLQIRTNGAVPPVGFKGQCSGVANNSSETGQKNSFKMVKLFYEVHRDGYYRTAGRRLDSGEGKVDVCARLRAAL